MRFLLMLTVTVILLAIVATLAVGYIEGEFDTAAEAVTWLRSLIEPVLS